MGRQKVFKTFFGKWYRFSGPDFLIYRGRFNERCPILLRKEDKPGSHRAAGREQFGQSLCIERRISALFSYENDALWKTEIKNRAANSGGKDVYGTQKQQRCRANECPNRHVYDPQDRGSA